MPWGSICPEARVVEVPVPSVDTAYYILRYQRDTSLTDITFIPLASTDLSHWSAPGAGGAPVGFSDTVIATNGTIETHEAKIPRSDSGKWFMRVQVSKP